MDFLKIKLIEYGFAVIVAPVAAIVFQLLKRYSSWVDNLGEWPKRAFVAVTVFAFVALGQVTGVDFGVTAEAESLAFIQDIDAATIKVVLGSALAYLLHAVKKQLKL